MTKYFLELGAKVAITSDLEKLKTQLPNLEAETGGTCLPLQCDVRHYEEVEVCYKAYKLMEGRRFIKQCCRKFHFTNGALSANAFDTVIDIVLKGTKLYVSIWKALD
jgi:enoyl-[acyl-carrier-protein] reductase (NADH)